MKKPADFKTEIAGQEWSFFFVRKGHPQLLPDAYGTCHWETKEIYIRYDLSEKNVRMIVIHEALHATCFLLFAAEEWVTDISIEINEAIAKAGL